MKHTVIAAITDAEVRPPAASGEKYPVVLFSHGLGGSFNAYSSILGALASCGVICIASEHRDQSCPISIIRSVDGTTTTVPYLALPHDQTPDVLAARNAQLRIRLWELELLYTAVEALEAGSALTNLAHQSTPSFHYLLDLQPGSVTWVGHSFGAASIVQLVKSVYWHQSLPNINGTGYEDDPDWQPLYTPAENSALSTQITAESPLVLLDLWTMPLCSSPSTRWLWEKALPCWAAETDARRSNVLAIMSEAFHNWSGLLQRTKSLLSADPEKGAVASKEADGRSPRLFYAPKTAHLSQSDFGCLFPWIGRRVLNAENPERTILLNVRAILQLFRERGVHVEAVQTTLQGGEKDDRGNDEDILSAVARVEGWTPLPLMG